MTPRRARAAQQVFGAAWLARRLRSLIENFAAAPIAIALSGGEDSVALLLAAAGLRRRGARLRAIHIDHRLQAASAQFAQSCAALCTRLKIPLTVVHARVDIVRGESLEAAARTARYQAFAATLLPGEQLLLAHHADDQLETVLLQLLRGAGVAGLAAMPGQARCGAGFIVRPLLDLPRAALREFLHAKGVEATIDPMNADLRFDRNFLRGEILPKLLERWPGAVAVAGRSARHAAEAQRLLTALGERDLEPLVDGHALTIAGLRALEPARRRNALRVFIERAGLPLPDTSRLNELAGPMLAARLDSAPSVQWSGVIATRDSQRLEIRAVSPLTQPPTREVIWEWQANRRVVLDAVPGVLALEEDMHGPLDLDQLPPSLRIDWRHGGERLRPRRGGPTRTLKFLLQSAGLPQRERAALPLIYAGDRLIAVADRWSDASVQASPSSQLRGRLSWRVRMSADAAMC